MRYPSSLALAGLVAAGAAFGTIDTAFAGGVPPDDPPPADRGQAPPPEPPVYANPAAPPSPPSVSSPWYWNLSAGAAFPQNTRLDAGPFTGSVNYGTGFHAFIGGGYRFNPWLAGEMEVGYLHLPVDRVSLGGASASVDGTLHGVAAFANVILRWPEWGAISPYIGGGPGFVHTFSSDFTATSGGTTVSGDIGSRTDFALQAKAGIDVRLSETVSIGPEYRYFWVNTEGDGLGNTNIHAVGATLKFRF